MDMIELPEEYAGASRLIEMWHSLKPEERFMVLGKGYHMLVDRGSTLHQVGFVWYDLGNYNKPMKSYSMEFTDLDISLKGGFSKWLIYEFIPKFEEEKKKWRI